MKNEFVVRVWRPGARMPAEGAVTITSELALDRDLLGVLDGSISRAANAPKLTPLTASILELEVPARSARAVLVIEGLRFEALQHAIAPANEAWKIAPGQLGRAGRIARGCSAAIALVRQLDWDRPGPTHYLLPLPAARQVLPGETIRVIAPALLIIGQAAADVTAADTAVPTSIPLEHDRTIAFRLAEVEALLEPLEPLERLEAFANARELGSLRVPGQDLPLVPAQLAHAARDWFNHGLRRHLFFPLLEDERLPRLALAYRRSDGSLGTLVSGPQPERFPEELIAYLKECPKPISASLPPRSSVQREPAPRHETFARFGAIETRNVRFGEVLNDLMHVAETDLSVLMLGESGTGKEHLAQAVHEASPRRRGPFVAVNCSAISDALIESELFGHRRGAYTGAQSERAGAFASAHGGTLLLDEIGDAPPRVQFALLRALESRRIKAVGADNERPVDVRVIAATSRDLSALMEQGSFRGDLYYRLAQLSVFLPPLRERPEDLPELCARLLEAELPGATLSHQALTLLEQHTWPGNIRELRNALKRALALGRGAKVLQTTHFARLTELTYRADPDLPTLRPPQALVFPPHVVALAERTWKDGYVSTAESVTATRQDHRAAQRAALLCLAVQRPFATWPKALSQHWHRLFGEKWATTEEGRGLRALLRELGLSARDEAVRGLLVELVLEVRNGGQR